MPRARFVLFAAVALVVLGLVSLLAPEARPGRLAAGAAPTTTAAPATSSTSTSTTSTTAPPSTSTPATAAAVPTTPAAPVVVGDGSAVLMVGDSVMLGAAPFLQALPGWSVTIDATVSRQFGAGYVGNGLETVRGYAEAGALGTEVVIHLGTNGPIRQDDLDALMGYLADVRRVVLVTVRIEGEYAYVADENDDLLRANVARYPNAVLADWQALAAQHPDWFADDPQAVHPNDEGHQAYANLVGSSL